MTKLAEVLHLDGVTVFVDDRVILKDVHIVLSAGEFCYLKGVTGSGKSSLVQALCGLLPMSGSRMFAAGHDLSELDASDLATYRRKIGLISDAYPLFMDKSVFANLDVILSVIDWPVASERERRVNEVLDQLGISHLQAELVRELPSGMRQKVAIARSVINKPKLILADNPMVYLDDKSMEDVMRLFVSLVKDQKTTVLCAVSDDHLMNKYPARSYFCGDGTITESW